MPTSDQQITETRITEEDLLDQEILHRQSCLQNSDSEIAPLATKKSNGSEAPYYQIQTTRRIWMLVLAITLHNIPEGMAVGVAFASSSGSSAHPASASQFVTASAISHLECVTVVDSSTAGSFPRRDAEFCFCAYRKLWAVSRITCWPCMLATTFHLLSALLFTSTVWVVLTCFASETLMGIGDWSESD
ncbi:unnamed protein product [Protopolystoma xenopodis]|uniref:Zinc transporter ZIP11 n=1 Tax=Protopolystoma xenopodis TaxID=117903 RepID=A0A3S5CLK3_9PLAT|nr:unnamed protein product [Protopolystoma xenopodis]